MTNPFDFINSITYNKKNLMDDPEYSESDYKPYLTNKALSYFVDTISAANEMNKFPFLDNRLQYMYYINSIRPKKRFSKWVKNIENEDLEAVKEYFDYNTERAKEALLILSDYNLRVIKEKIKKGE